MTGRLDKCQIPVKKDFTSRIVRCYFDNFDASTTIHLKLWRWGVFGK